MEPADAAPARRPRRLDLQVPPGPPGRRRSRIMKTVRIGSGSGFWGDNLDPAIEIANKGDVQYLAYDFLGEPTIPILQKMRQKNPEQGFVPAIRAVVRGVLPICLEKGIKIL